MDTTTKTKFKRLISLQDISCESSAEYILPDYQGDVRRILFTEASVKPSGKFSDEGSEEFAGVVVYDVLYLDAENTLTRATFTSDYDLIYKCSDEKRTGVLANPAVHGYTIRLTGPRRFSAKATVGAHVRCIGEDEILVYGTAMDKRDGLETLDAVMRVRCAEESETVEREYAERIERLEGVPEDEVEVLYSGVEVGFDEVSAEDGAVNLKGEARMLALVLSGEMPLYLVEKIVPINEKVLFPEVREDMKLIPNANVQSVVSSINADEGGTDIVLSAIIEYSVIGEYNESVSCIKDAYHIDYPTVNSYTEYVHGELLDCVVVSENVSTQISREEITSEGLRELPYLSATFKVESIDVSELGATVKGEIRIGGISTLTDEDGNISYSALKLTQPVEKVIKCKIKDGDSSKVDVDITATDVCATVDTDNVKLSCKLRGSLISSYTGCERMLKETNITDEEDVTNNGGKITVYYPTSSDTLFSVAKSFRAPLAKLAEDNGINVTASADGAGNELSGLKRLFIY